MVGHQAIRENSHWPFFERFNNDSLESEIVLVLVEQLLFTDASIENVVDHCSGSVASGSGHRIKLPSPP